MTALTLNLDFETYSEADITKVGAYRYAMHPSAEALMLAWAINDGDTNIWDIASGEEMPLELAAALKYKDTMISAFNANFERLILKHVLHIDIPVSHFKCSMVRAYSLSFTGGLEAVASQFGLNVKKDSKGKALIRHFSQPQPKSRKVERWTHHNDPDGWEEFKNYCAQDVAVERELMRKLEAYDCHHAEQGYYCLDQQINDTGVPVDKRLIEAAIKLNDVERKRLITEMKALTGLDNPNSGQQLLKWLAEHGLILQDLQKATVKRELSRDTIPEQVVPVLKLKQQLAKTSVTKWQAYQRSVCPDNRLHGMFQFAGASRTQRWAGRLVQLQNLARGGNTTHDPDTLAEYIIHDPYMVKPLYGNVMDALSDTLRAAITAPEGKMLVVSDLSSIESRVLGWVSDCTKINETFAEGLDTYKVFASALYDTPYDKITKQQRGFCKPPVLGCGYGLGAKGLIGYAEAMGVKMSEAETQTVVSVFRSEYSEIVDLWSWCQTAVFHTTRTQGSCEGKHGLRTYAHGEFLFLQLPSGRCIAYHKPKIEPKEAPWGDVIDNFTFMGKDRFTQKWTRISATPGFLVENCIASGTKVLTDSGWKNIEDISGKDLIHDGIEFVNHTGLLYGGVQTCISVDGVYMTPDHEVLNEEQEWERADEIDRPYRPTCWKAGSFEKIADGVKWPTSLGISMRLRGRKNSTVGRNDKETSEGPNATLRVRGHAGEESYSRYVETPSLCSVSEYDRPMQTPNTSSMEELRWKGDSCLHTVARRVREFLSRHERLLQIWANFGQNRQRKGVFSPELPVGILEDSKQQSQREYLCEYAKWQNDCLNSSGYLWCKTDYAVLPAGAQLTRRETVYPSGLYESSVWDITNCGPRQRFVVLGDSGPIIVHNCVQAIARDVLCVWLQRAAEAGFTICGHVHDEVITLESTDRLEELNALARQPISWAKGLLLDAEGYVARRYRKE